MSECFNNKKFDIFPLIFPVGEKVKFKIKANASKKSFCGECLVKVLRIDLGSPNEEFTKNNCTEILTR